MFKVRLDKMVTKWAGSIEIGVTSHAPSDLEFPSTMTNVRSGTWMMTGNGVSTGKPVYSACEQWIKLFFIAGDAQRDHHY